MWATARWRPWPRAPSWRLGRISTCARSPRARSVGLSGARPWLDTVLPIALAAFAVAPAALYPFLGQFAIAPTAAVFVLFFAGMSFSLGLGPYANVKVALAR